MSLVSAIEEIKRSEKRVADVAAQIVELSKIIETAQNSVKAAKEEIEKFVIKVEIKRVGDRDYEMRIIHVGFPCICFFRDLSLGDVVMYLKIQYNADRVVAHYWKPQGNKTICEVETAIEAYCESMSQCHTFYSIKGIGPEWVFDLDESYDLER